MHRARSYIYHETFRVFRHDTGYGVCTEQIPCLGVGPTPEHAIADLVHRVHRTKLPLVLAYAAMPDEAPIPTDIDYLDGRLSVQVSVQNGTYRYQVHLLDLVGQRTRRGNDGIAKLQPQVTCSQVHSPSSSLPATAPTLLRWVAESVAPAVL